MTIRISLLSAALALGTFAALPALAQSMTSPSPVPSATTESTVKSPAGDKAAPDKKTHEQVAQHPGAATKGDITLKPDTTGK
jgi:photosystem II stability/assembly factor-like uncharacterized protein